MPKSTPMPNRGENSVESGGFNVLLGVLLSPGPRVSAGRSAGRMVNVGLIRLGHLSITQNNAREKNKLRAKLFAFVIECVDVFRQLTYSSSAYSGR